LGPEGVISYSTFVRLAERLAELGFAALRFDYRSTGDAFDRVADGCNRAGFAWDVGLALDFVRALGADHVGVVGMRLGADFAFVRCGLEPVEALVLWDPCPTGRSFLREQRALGLIAGVTVGEDTTVSVELPGFRLAPEMASEIAAIDLTSCPPGTSGAGELAQHTLLLTRSERIADRKLAERLGAPHLEHREVPGQPELLDVKVIKQAVPTEALENLAGWLDDVMPQSRHKIAVPTRREITVPIQADRPTASEAPDGETPGGEAPGGESVLVRERAVSLGPAELFAIETEPVSGGHGPTCIFASVANGYRAGPSRTWVLLSRRLAAAGFRCVRFDGNGYGDSPARPDQPKLSFQSVGSIDDVLDAARAVSPEDPADVVLFGLSSSGYSVLEAALELRPRGVCSVNPSLVFQPPEMAASGEMDERRRFCLPWTAFVAAARGRASVQWLGLRFPTVAARVRKALRKVAWRFRSVAAPHRNRPGERLGDLARAGTDVLLICGPEEVQPFFEPGIAAVRRAERSGRLEVMVIPNLEHSLLPSADRDEVTDVIFDHLLATFRRAAVS